jgi:hypothetical protein
MIKEATPEIVNQAKQALLGLQITNGLGEKKCLIAIQ